jgi:hypothetical protein
MTEDVGVREDDISARRDAALGEGEAKVELGETRLFVRYRQERVRLVHTGKCFSSIDSLQPICIPCGPPRTSILD